jgi:serine protease Do
MFAAALVPATAFAGEGSNTTTNHEDMSQTQDQVKTDEPTLGVTVTQLSTDQRTHFGAPTDSGLLVSKVDSDSPAQRAGIKVGDVITKIGTNKLMTASDVDTFLGTAQQGSSQKVAIQVIRNEKTLTLHVTPTASQSSPGMSGSGDM